MAYNATLHKGTTSPGSNYSSADSFLTNEDVTPGLGRSDQRLQENEALLNSLTFEKIEEYNRLKEIKLKKLHIQSNLSKETKN